MHVRSQNIGIHINAQIVIIILIYQPSSGVMVGWSVSTGLSDVGNGDVVMSDWLDLVAKSSVEVIIGEIDVGFPRKIN